MKRLSDMLGSRSSQARLAFSGPVITEATVMRSVAREIAQRLGDAEGSIPAPEELRELRARVLQQWEATASVEGMDARLRKRVPSVLFIPADDPAEWVAKNGELCKALLEWIIEKRRSAVAFGLVREFLRAYPTELATFAVIRDGLRAIAHDREVSKSGTLLDTCREAGHLEVDGPRRISKFLLAAESPPQRTLESLRLTGGLETSAFSYATFCAMVAELERRSPEEEPRVVERSLVLLETGPTTLRLSEPSFCASLASALLGPLARREPTAATRDALFKFCLRHFGDPRARDARWSGVAKDARDVMVRWLVQESFDVYFKILDRTADDRHWSYRRPFWERYLQRGDVIDAWAVLGRAAALEASNRRVRAESYGVMRTGDKYQSALLMRMRGARGLAVVAEWSHNGSCRIWSDERKHVPPFYQREYDPDALRRNPEIQVAHHGSEQGRWQYIIQHDLMQKWGIPP